MRRTRTGRVGRYRSLTHFSNRPSLWRAVDRFSLSDVHARSNIWTRVSNAYRPDRAGTELSSLHPSKCFNRSRPSVPVLPFVEGGAPYVFDDPRNHNSPAIGVS